MKTLARHLLLFLGVAFLLIVLTVAATAYWAAARQAREDDLGRRQVALAEMAQNRSETFMLALHRLELARDDALARLEGTRKSDASIRFGHDSARRDDGSIRLHADNFDPQWEPGIFVPAGRSPDEETKHRIVSFRDTANLFGQAWRKDFPNLWFAGPEGWLVAYWPEHAWTEKLAADVNLTEESWFEHATLTKNAKKGPVWSAAHTNPSGKETVVTLSLPLYVGEKLIGVVAQDVPLRQLHAAMAVDGPDAGARRLAFAPDGAILAMSGRTAEIHQAGGALKAVQVREAASAITAIQAHGETAGRIRDAASSQTVLYNTLDTPPWTLAVLVADGAGGGSGAFRVSLFVTLAAVLAALAGGALMAQQIRTVLTQPLRQLSGAVASIAHGHADVVVPTGARGEIAEVAEALAPMRDAVASKLAAAKEEKAALTAALGEAQQKAEETQRRLDEEKVVAEDRARRLDELQQRYDALVETQNTTLDEALPDAAVEGTEPVDEVPAQETTPA